MRIRPNRLRFISVLPSVGQARLRCLVALLEVDLDRLEEERAGSLDLLTAEAAENRQREAGLDMAPTL